METDEEIHTARRKAPLLTDRRFLKEPRWLKELEANVSPLWGACVACVAGVRSTCSRADIARRQLRANKTQVRAKVQKVTASRGGSRKPLDARGGSFAALGGARMRRPQNIQLVGHKNWATSSSALDVTDFCRPRYPFIHRYFIISSRLLSFHLLQSIYLLQNSKSSWNLLNSVALFGYLHTGKHRYLLKPTLYPQLEQ